jgi:hypothetical protein
LTLARSIAINGAMVSAPQSRAALVVSHPSHELRIHAWLEQARPLTFVLTDGAGRAGEPRLPATTRVLAAADAPVGPIYGRLSDLALYAALLDGDVGLFVALAAELADALVAEGIELVAGDCAEGYSVAHDVCRMIVNAAVARAGRCSGRAIANADFLLLAAPDAFCAARRDAIWVHLDDAQAQRKLDAAVAYHPKLAADVATALDGAPFRGIARFSEPRFADAVDEGVKARVAHAVRDQPALAEQLRALTEGVPLSAFRVECLRPVDAAAPIAFAGRPFFEYYGEQLVAAGRYQRVIRFAEHLAPVQDALADFVAQA